MHLWVNVWLILPVELLHGITFGLTWSVGSKKCSIISPPGLEATTQSVFQGLMFGLGYGLGGLIGGQVYELRGPSTAFAVEFGITLFGWITSSIVQYTFKKEVSDLKRKYSDGTNIYSRVPINEDDYGSTEMTEL